MNSYQEQLASEIYDTAFKLSQSLGIPMEELFKKFYEAYINTEEKYVS